MSNAKYDLLFGHCRDETKVQADDSRISDVESSPTTTDIEEEHTV